MTSNVGYYSQVSETVTLLEIVMKVFVGNHLRLSGKTRHGKNRIRENGDLWEVINVDGQGFSLLTTKVCVIPIKELTRRDQSGDGLFEITKIYNGHGNC